MRASRPRLEPPAGQLRKEFLDIAKREVYKRIKYPLSGVNEADSELMNRILRPSLVAASRPSGGLRRYVKTRAVSSVASAPADQLRFIAPYEKGNNP